MYGYFVPSIMWFSNFFPRDGYDQMRFFRWLWSLESEAQKSAEFFQKNTKKRCSAFSHNHGTGKLPWMKGSYYRRDTFSISMIMGGRVGSTWIGNTWINHCFFVLFKCFAGLVLWLAIGTSFWRAATRPTKKALADLTSELSFCGCKKIKPLADPMTVAQRWQENQAAVFLHGKLGKWWLFESSPKLDGEFPSKKQKPLAVRNLSLDALDKRIMESPENSGVFCLEPISLMNFPLEKRRWWFSPNKSVL